MLRCLNSVRFSSLIVGTTTGTSDNAEQIPFKSITTQPLSAACANKGAWSIWSAKKR